MAGREVISKTAFWLFSLAGCCYCCSCCCSWAFSIRELTTKSLSHLKLTSINYLLSRMLSSIFFIFVFASNFSLSLFYQSNFFPKHLLYFSPTAGNLQALMNALVHFLALSLWDTPKISQ